MRIVSKFEANLLRMLQGILQRTPREQTQLLLFAGTEAPPCLGRAAVDLVQSYLTKGCIALVAKEGWRHDRYLRDNRVAAGRLWQRTAPEDLGLSFSRHALEFLLWLVGPPDQTWEPKQSGLTLGDRFLFALGYRTLREAEAAKALKKHAYFAADAFTRLTFPEDPFDAPASLDWTPWTTPPESCILEAWQRHLTDRWVRVELSKGNLASSSRMRALGENQNAILTGFTDAIDKAGRRDLGGFLLAALGRLLSASATAQNWIGKLNVRELRLADRTRSYRAALIFLDHAKRLQAWQRDAQTVGYFEENYAASQLWKSLWEQHHGDELCLQAERILAEIEPLRN